MPTTNTATTTAATAAVPCACPTCAADRAQAAQYGTNGRNSVWNAPRQLIFFQADEGESKKLPGVGRLFLGWELEVEFARCRITREAMLERIRKPYLFFKTDGSLNNGVEIVAHPMTYAFLKSKRTELKEMLREMVRQGMRGYEPGTAGIHVHMAKDAFTSMHLYKFMKLVYENPDLTVKVSQRQRSRLDQWASITRENPTDARLKQKAEAKNGNIGGAGRYVAVNLQPANTVEIRLFRSTLKAVSFFKCIEYVTAAYFYSKDAELGDLTQVKFLAWIASQREEYPNLYKFLVKRRMITAPASATPEAIGA
jgi:hypothetical protein